MGKALLETEVNLKRAKILLKKFSENEVDLFDRLKIEKIKDHVKTFNTITSKQFRTLNHYCGVYKIKLLQSLDFILD